MERYQLCISILIIVIQFILVLMLKALYSQSHEKKDSLQKELNSLNVELHNLKLEYSRLQHDNEKPQKRAANSINKLEQFEIKLACNTYGQEAFNRQMTNDLFKNNLFEALHIPLIRYNLFDDKVYKHDIEELEAEFYTVVNKKLAEK